jgi:hypothetical protein
LLKLDDTNKFKLEETKLDFLKFSLSEDEISVILLINFLYFFFKAALFKPIKFISLRNKLLSKDPLLLAKFLLAKNI